MTSEERIASLRARMDALREKKERQKTAWLGSGCAALAVCLILLICSAGKGGSGVTAGIYSGATMLFENAGGYVAVAVLAFMLGVVITVACIRHKDRHGNGQDNATKERDS